MLRDQYFIFVLLSFFVRQFGVQSDQDIDNQIIEVFNNCKCVPYIECGQDNYIITDSTYLITLRMDNDERRINCRGGEFTGFLVCCKEKNNTLAMNPPNADDETGETDRKEYACGKQKPELNIKILNDDENDTVPVSGEFPWLATVFKKNDFGQYVLGCSGSLIHPKVILTVNHHVHGKRAEDFKVVLNGQIEFPVIGNNTSEERNVVEIVHHSHFHSKLLYNDIALLILDKPYVNGKNFVNKICLPPNDINMEGMRCLVTGWENHMKYNGGIKTLNKVELPFIEHSKCENMLRKTRLGSRFKLHKTFLCAGGEKNKDACIGDGGSPLMCRISGGEARYFQAGIVAWGIGCGHQNVPGVYTNVQEFKKWIENELENRNLAHE